MKINNPVVRYPVLRINDVHIQRFDRPSDLWVTGQYFLDRGAYRDGTVIVDSVGSCYSVSNGAKRRRSLSWRYWGAKYPAWVMEVSVEDPFDLLLEIFNEELQQTIIRNGWLSQAYDSKDELEKELNSAESFRDLITRISFFGKWVKKGNRKFD